MIEKFPVELSAIKMKFDRVFDDFLIKEEAKKITERKIEILKRKKEYSKMKFRGKFGGKGNKNGNFLHPNCLFYDQISDHLIISDKNNHRIQIFDQEFSYIGKIGKYGRDKKGEFNYPRLGIDNINGNIFVSDSSNRLQIFDKFQNFIGGFSFSPYKNNFNNLNLNNNNNNNNNINLNLNNKINNKIKNKNLNLNNNLIYDINNLTNNNNNNNNNNKESNNASGIWITNKQEILISDPFSKFVQIFDFSGRLIETISFFSSPNDHFNHENNFNNNYNYDMKHIHISLFPPPSSSSSSSSDININNNLNLNNNNNNNIVNDYYNNNNINLNNNNNNNNLNLNNNNNFDNNLNNKNNNLNKNNDDNLNNNINNNNVNKNNLNNNNNNINNNLNNKEKEKGIYGITMNSRDEIIITEKESNRILFYNLNSPHLLSSFTINNNNINNNNLNNNFNNFNLNNSPINFKNNLNNNNNSNNNNNNLINNNNNNLNNLNLNLNLNNNNKTELKGIKVDEKDNIIVAEYGANKVEIIDITGNSIIQLGEKGIEDGQFKGPYDVAIHPFNSNLYVVEFFNHRIQLFTPY